MTERRSKRGEEGVRMAMRKKMYTVKATEDEKEE